MTVTSCFERWLLKVWYPEKGDQNVHIYPVLLWPISMLYRLIIKVRYFYYKRKARNLVKKYPVIVVGNITVGGTGKTPFVVYLCELLKNHGYSPGVISRGFKAQKQKHETISVTQDTPIEKVGDEPALIWQKTNCPVVVGSQRNLCLQHMEKAHPEVNIIVSDDGLQHYAMQRDIEIVLIDGKRLLGNGHCLPAGPLREPRTRLNTVDFIVVKNGTYPNASEMTILSEAAFNLKQSHQQKKLTDFLPSKLHAVTGIGHAMSFFNTLVEHGLTIQQHAFSDHHPFQAKDFAFAGDDPIIMTEKDAIKCQSFAEDNFWVLPIRAALPKSFEIRLLRKIEHG